MGIARQRVFRHDHLFCLTPCRLAALRHHQFRVAWEGRVGAALRQVELLSRRCKARCTLVIVGVHPSLHRLRLAPFPSVIFPCHKQVACLPARNIAQSIARGLVAGRGKIKYVVVVAGEHGRIVIACRAKEIHAFHLIA